MDKLETLLSAGFAALKRGDTSTAINFFTTAAEASPGDKRVALQAARGLSACGEPRAAAAVLERAVAENPASWSLVEALANAFLAAGMERESTETLKAIARRQENLLAAGPATADIWADLGGVRARLNQPDLAETAYRNALAVDPSYPKALLRLGDLLMAQGQVAEAAELFARACDADGSDALAYLGAARAALRLAQFENAVAAAQTAASLAQEAVEAHQVLGAALLAAGQPSAARASLALAAERQPDSVGTLINLAKAEAALGNAAAAETLLRQAVALDPTNTDAREILERGVGSGIDTLTRLLLQRAWDADRIHAHTEARRHYDAVLERSPGHVFALSRLLTLDGIEGRLAQADETHRALVENLQRSNLGAINWMHLALIAYQSVLRPMPRALYNAVTSSIDRQLRATPTAPALPPSRTSGRIRIGYLSSMLRDHPIGHVTAALFAAHDRSRFEVHVFYLPEGPETSFTRDIARDTEHFIALPETTEAMVAAIAAREIDILIYLDGYMALSLLPVVAARPARRQVFWLGHAGNCDISAIDDFITDATVVPAGEESLYRAQILRLPDTYHCASPHPIAAPMTRAEAGLPDEGFVFCAFNNPEKIDTAVFDIWMRILARVEGSVLWLSRTLSAAVEENLRAAAAARGIDGARLVFASRLPDKSRHLARHFLCGLFLDTLSLNASTTALDALWSGLPVLTVRGARFGARIASSFLNALGLETMIAPDLTAYEGMAVHLATHPDALAEIHAQLAESLEARPLFKADVFCHEFEATLEKIYCRNNE